MAYGCPRTNFSIEHNLLYRSLLKDWSEWQMSQGIRRQKRNLGRKREREPLFSPVLRSKQIYLTSRKFQSSGEERERATIVEQAFLCRLPLSLGFGWAFSLSFYLPLILISEVFQRIVRSFSPNLSFLASMICEEWPVSSLMQILKQSRFNVFFFFCSP